MMNTEVKTKKRPQRHAPILLSLLLSASVFNSWAAEESRLLNNPRSRRMSA